MDGRNDGANRVLEVGLEIASSHDPFLGIEVDQDHRPLVEAAHLRHDRTLERDEHRPDVDRPQRQLLERHERDLRPSRGTTCP